MYGQQQQYYPPRRDQMGHRRVGTGRRTTPSKRQAALGAGPLADGMAYMQQQQPQYGYQQQHSARHQMFDQQRRPGTGRKTTPRRFDGIEASAMKNPNGRLSMMMGGAREERAPLQAYVNGALQSRPSNVGAGYHPAHDYRQEPIYRDEPAAYRQYHEPTYSDETAHDYRHETVLRQQPPPRSMQRKKGTGRVTPRGGFTGQLTISGSAKQEARMKMAQQHQAQQQTMHHQLASQLPYQSDTSAEFSEGDSMTMAIRAPPASAAEMLDDSYGPPEVSRGTASADDEEEEMAIRAPPPSLEQMMDQGSPHAAYPAVERVSTAGSPATGSYATTDESRDHAFDSSAQESVEFHDDGMDMQDEPSTADTSVSSEVPSEASEHETTIDPDEEEERLRKEAEEAKAWERNPEDEHAELDQQAADDEMELSMAESVEQQVSEGEESPQVEERRPKKKKKAEKRQDYQYEPLEQPEAYVITPPAEPSPAKNGLRRSRRRKMTPLKFWKGESVIYKRRLSGKTLDLVQVRKCPDALTPYKRRKQAPLAIMDRA